MKFLATLALMVAMATTSSSLHATQSSSSSFGDRPCQPGVKDDTCYCIGDCCVDIDVDITSPITGTYEVTYTDGSGSNGGNAATPHPKGGVSDAASGLTSSGGTTYKIEDCRVKKKGPNDTTWKRVKKKRKPTEAQFAALYQAYITFHDPQNFWEITPHGDIPTLAQFNGFTDQMLASPNGDGVGTLPFGVYMTQTGMVLFGVPGEDIGTLGLVIVGPDGNNGWAVWDGLF